MSKEGRGATVRLRIRQARHSKNRLPEPAEAAYHKQASACSSGQPRRIVLRGTLRGGVGSSRPSRQLVPRGTSVRNAEPYFSPPFAQNSSLQCNSPLQLKIASR